MPVSIKSLKWNNSFTNQGEFNFRHFLDMLIYDLLLEPHQPVTGLLPTCVVSTGIQVIVGFSLTISHFGILGVSVCFVYCVEFDKTVTTRGGGMKSYGPNPEMVEMQKIDSHPLY